MIPVKILYTFSTPVVTFVSVQSSPNFPQAQETQDFKTYSPPSQISCESVQVGITVQVESEPPHHQPQPQPPHQPPGFAFVVTENVQIRPLIVNIAVVCVLYAEEEVCWSFILSQENSIQVTQVYAPLLILYVHQAIVTWPHVINPVIVISFDS